VIRKYDSYLLTLFEDSNILDSFICKLHNLQLKMTESVTCPKFKNFEYNGLREYDFKVSEENYFCNFSDHKLIITIQFFIEFTLTLLEGIVFFGIVYFLIYTICYFFTQFLKIIIIAFINAFEAIFIAFLSYIGFFIFLIYLFDFVNQYH